MKEKLRILKEICRLKNSLDVDESGEVYESSNCCGKKTFETETEALTFIRDYSASNQYNNNTRKPHRAYQCSAGKWHLTSTPKKQYEQMLRKTGQK